MCRIAHCTKPSAGGRTGAAWATLCNTHRRRERRHGDPLQNPILVSHLAQYLRSLDKRQKAKPNAAIWGMLVARWGSLIDRCHGVMTTYAAGTPTIRWEQQAAAELIRVADEAKADDVWRIAAAMFMLREYEPRRFASDNGFLVQLGRRVRHLASANRGSFIDPSTGGVKFVYRDVNQRVAVLIGQMLAEAFGVAGLKFAEQDQQEVEQREAERKAFHRALNEVA